MIECIEAMQLSENLVVMEGEVTLIQMMRLKKKWQDGLVVIFGGKVRGSLLGP